MKRFLMVVTASLASLASLAGAAPAALMSATQNHDGRPTLFIAKDDGLFMWDDPAYTGGKGLQSLWKGGRFRAISAARTGRGDSAVFVIPTDGSLWEYNPEFGGNGWRQLAVPAFDFTAGSTFTFSKPASAGAGTPEPGAYLLRSDGTLWEFNPWAARTGFRQVSAPAGYTAISATFATSLDAPVVYALRGDGSVDEWDIAKNQGTRLAGQARFIDLSASLTSGVVTAPPPGITPPPLLDAHGKPVPIYYPAYTTKTVYPVVFTLRADGTLWEHCAAFGGDGWKQVTDRKDFTAIGALSNVVGRDALVFAANRDGRAHKFTHRNATELDEPASTPLPGRGTVTELTAVWNFIVGQTSDVSNEVFFVRESDGSVYEWDPKPLTGEPNWVPVLLPAGGK